MINTPTPPWSVLMIPEIWRFSNLGQFSHKFTTFSPTVLVVKNTPKFNSESPWKMMGTEDDPFPFGFRLILRGELFNFKEVVRTQWLLSPFSEPESVCYGFELAIRLAEIRSKHRGQSFLWISATFSGYVVEPTHLKNISQNRNLPLFGVKIKHIWNHHLVLATAHSGPLNFGSFVQSLSSPGLGSLLTICLLYLLPCFYTFDHLLSWKNCG